MNSIGIPTEVTLYHPIEFLELGRLTKAFFDTNLESLKGGVKNQLLIGHIIHYVQDNGLKSFTAFPRFKNEYLNELVTKAQEKGLDLKKVKEQNFNLNWDKVRKLSEFNMVYRSDDTFDQAANIYSSANYKMFNRLEFNRDISIRHVNKLIISMKRNKVISYPLMIHTDCVDGEMKWWIVDGQHRFEAMRRLGLPIWFTLYEKQEAGSITLYDLVRLVADVNNTSKPWNIHQYLKAWKSLGVREYQKIYETHEKTGLAITTLLQAYSGMGRSKATNMFIEGNYVMEDEGRGDSYISYLKILKPVLPRNTMLFTSLLEFFKQRESYDNERMRKALGKADIGLLLAEKEENIVTNLRNLYENAV